MFQVRIYQTSWNHVRDFSLRVLFVDNSDYLEKVRSVENLSTLESLNTGPPELPGLTAILTSASRPGCMKKREMVPEAIEMLFPPEGYPAI
jgi:hypothetical protein